MSARTLAEVLEAPDEITARRLLALMDSTAERGESREEAA